MGSITGLFSVGDEPQSLCGIGAFGDKYCIVLLKHKFGSVKWTVKYLQTNIGIIKGD